MIFCSNLVVGITSKFFKKDYSKNERNQTYFSELFAELDSNDKVRIAYPLSLVALFLDWSQMTYLIILLKLSLMLAGVSSICYCRFWPAAIASHQQISTSNENSLDPWVDYGYHYPDRNMSLALQNSRSRMHEQILNQKKIVKRRYHMTCIPMSK